MGKQGGSTYPGGLVKMEVDGEEEIVEMEPEAEVSNEPVEGWNEISALKDVKRRAQLCILADNCSEPAYKKLVSALCTEHGVPMMTVEDQMELGEWAGLCKIDAEGNATKVVKASCVVIHNWGEDSPARQYLLENHIE